MIATRRRGYKSVTEAKVPKVAVFHPDAWMYKVKATSSKPALVFAYPWETRGHISKIIIDDIVYEGSSISDVSNGNQINISPGEHIVYVYFTSNDVCGIHNDLGNEKIIPYELRTSRNNTDTNFPSYYPQQCTFYLCSNAVMYPNNNMSTYFNKNNFRAYVPVGMQETYLNNATWKGRSMTEENFIEVNYKFVED